MPSPRLRASRAKTLADWTKEWRVTGARTGHFAVANRIPPSLKSTEHFTALQNEREVDGRVVQCLTGHCFQGRMQTRECTRYDDYCDILRKASRNIVLSEILGTERGLAVLSEFLRKSSAFTKTEEPRAAPSRELEPEDYGGWKVEDEDEVDEEWR